MCIHTNDDFNTIKHSVNKSNASSVPDKKRGLVRSSYQGSGLFHASWGVIASNDASVAATVADLKRWHNFDPAKHVLDFSHVNEVRRSIGLSEVTEEGLPVSNIAPIESVDAGEESGKDTPEEVVGELDEYLAKQESALVRAESVGLQGSPTLPNLPGFKAASVTVTYLPDAA